MSTYRYPGAQPFQTRHSHIFYGRNRDIDQLRQYLYLEKLVILYSRSGLGKSSLLNAGIIPLVRSEGRLEPISIRFGASREGIKENPLQLTGDFLESGDPKDGFLRTLIPEENSLWELLKSRQIANGAKSNGYLLIFDQFEELFTYPEADQLAFKKQFAELLYSSVPQRFLDQLRSQIEGDSQILTDEQMAALHRPLNVKAIIAIRSDRMHMLNALADYLPGILSRCYELGPLDKEEAEDAIINPAYDRNDGFLSPHFDYEDEAIERILSFLTNEQTQPIESFQLQILCQFVEQKVLEKDLKIITREDIGSIEKLYENYYDDQINRLESPDDQLAARRMIEEGLVFAEEERRLSLYEGQIHQAFGVRPELLGQLVDCRLLRAEASPRGGYTYELSHDTLIGPVLRAKARRLEQERLQQLMQERQKRETELQKEQKKRRRASFLALFGFLLAAIAVAALLYAIAQNQIIRDKEMELSYALKIYKQADEEKNAIKIRQFIEDTRILLESEDYHLAGFMISKAYALDSTDLSVVKVKEKVDSLINHQ